HDNFFEAGGTSLHSILLKQEIKDKLGYDVSITDLFAYPTVAALAGFLRGGEVEAPLQERRRSSVAEADRAVAVIGMSGRFPDAADVDAFWENVKNGVESLRTFTDEELRAAGIGAELLARADYVKSGVLLDGIEDFDAAYFGFTPREAEVTDPQQRLLFECAVEALEHAGYGDDGAKRPVGVYVGVGESRYFFEHLLPQAELVEPVRTAAIYGNRPDYAATRLSYRLNLSGPSVSVGTACSTSLVAVHQACTALLNDECELALAGGASITLLRPQGYLYQEGSIASPDGHCRTFDADAKGTRSGSGAGLVVLKRLSRAHEDGDTVYAVIKGSSINNDGSDKVGYTAPSVSGQAQAIRDALALADIEAESVQYIEAHGTATELGDPIEVRALARAFRSERRQYCALGSVKANIGHLDTAAGVAGLIKTVKALQTQQLPPSINFRRANPKIDFENTPFYVNTELKAWPATDVPRRAGVSSFGIGGTNAHVVLEEAPPRVAGQYRRARHLLLLSARSEAALAQSAARLAAHLQRNRDASLGDVAYTLHTGRAQHGFRSAVLVESVDEAIAALTAHDDPRVLRGSRVDAEAPSLIFMFTGQGSQYLRMGADLYAREPAFRAVVDECAELLQPELGCDLRAVLFPADDGAIDEAEAERLLARTEMSQPALFVIEYAVARVLGRWGIVPSAMIGHSLGEYVAACLAGVFTPADALRIVARRGKLMQAAETGRMLSIKLPERDAQPLIGAAGCALAAVNSAGDCVASGAPADIERLAAALAGRGVTYAELRTSHAFHSPMMSAVASSLRELLRGIELHAPKLPYVSNVSGRFVEAHEATDPDYWLRHMLGTVRFASGIETLATDTSTLQPERVWIEVGPGTTLASLARKHAALQGHKVLATMRHRHETHRDDHFLERTLAQLWLSGATVDWGGFHEGERCRRVALPTYPFERRRYWIDRNTSAPPVAKRVRADSPSAWFYAPVWKELAPVRDGGTVTPGERWLVLCDAHGIGRALCDELELRGANVAGVELGNAYARRGEHAFTMDGGAAADYERLLRELGIAAGEAVRVVHLWSIGASGEDSTDRALQSGFDSLLSLAREFTSVCPAATATIDVVTDAAVCVSGEEEVDATAAAMLGLAKVVPQEMPHLRTFLVDIHCAARGATARTIANRLLAEATSTKRRMQVALRGSKRWELVYEPCEIVGEDALAKAGWHYVITGGLGKIGLTLAEHLAQRGAAALTLISRNIAASEPTMARLRSLEAGGTKIHLAAGDVADAAQLTAILDHAERTCGRIDGVVHCAGKVHDAMRPLGELTPAACRDDFAAKIRGTQALDRALAGRDFGFCMLMSSLAAVLGGLGFGAYAAANSYLDAFAQRKHGEGDRRWLAVNWDGWNFAAERARTPRGERTGMSPAEGVEAFVLALRLLGMPQLVNSAGDLGQRIEQWLTPEARPKRLAARHARPELPTPHVEPANETERSIAAIWRDVLGIDGIGSRDNFFELGGDSVTLVEVHKAVRAELNAEVTVAHLFQFPTIGELAAFLARPDAGAIAERIVGKRMDRRRRRTAASESSEVPA
ncbi:MAG TPA: SDR family NAD(P)-dependent oxidoreductase, partial [Rudaea sp.]|nr:SDR family NAD(P)-dependent oxidoreductase [Rudaea sp.]